MRFQTVQAALEGRREFKKFIYFFNGDKYTRFDCAIDREDFGYPRDIEAWHLPAAFNSGADAAINGQGEFQDFAYFFKGPAYSRYNWKRDVVDRRDVPLSEWKLPHDFLSGVDAIIDGQGDFAGKTYFFKGARYVRYHWAFDVAEGPFDIAPAWNLPGDFNNGIDAAANDPESEGAGYLFKDNRYVRYDWLKDKVVGNYPRPIQGFWRHGIAVWANIDTPTSVDRDARLHDENGGLVRGIAYPNGTTRGQAGWDIGLSFGSSEALARKLTHSPEPTPSFICGNTVRDCPALSPGQISRLAINAHGDMGQVALWGRHDARRLTAQTLLGLNEQDAGTVRDLVAIRDAMESDGVVMFVGCLAGKSLGGTALLTALSLLFAGRTVVAFKTVGFSHGSRQSRKGSGPAHSTEAGMRDTDQFIESSSEEEENQRYLPIWNDLHKLPWASEFSPHAKVAKNGFIIRGQD